MVPVVLNGSTLALGVVVVGEPVGFGFKSTMKKSYLKTRVYKLA